MVKKTRRWKRTTPQKPCYHKYLCPAAWITNTSGIILGCLGQDIEAVIMQLWGSRGLSSSLLWATRRSGIWSKVNHISTSKARIPKGSKKSALGSKITHGIPSIMANPISALSNSARYCVEDRPASSVFPGPIPNVVNIWSEKSGNTNPNRYLKYTRMSAPRSYRLRKWLAWVPWLLDIVSEW